VQCQRSHYYLLQPHETDLGWLCPGWPGCPGGESYALIDDPALLAYTDAAVTACETLFGPRDLPGAPLAVVQGVQPYAEMLYNTHTSTFFIAIAHDSNFLQQRWQVAHEVFHRVRSRAGGGATHHWAHEMLATLFAAEHTRNVGLGRYAEGNVEQYRREAPALPLEDFLRVTTASYPPCVYARGYIVGEALLAVCGWQRLAPLASSFDASGKPDINAWLRSLPAVTREAAERVLAP
jgi:hypothetical protein